MSIIDRVRNNSNTVRETARGISRWFKSPKDELSELYLDKIIFPERRYNSITHEESPYKQIEMNHIQEWPEEIRINGDSGNS